MDALEFNKRLRKMRYDTKSFAVMFDYCMDIMKRHIRLRFGHKDFEEDVVHEIIESFITDEIQEGFIENPAGWLCTLADNRVKSYLRRMDNNALELQEEHYIASDIEDSVEVLGPKFSAAWSKVGAKYRTILILEAIFGYSLKDISAIIDVKYPTVRARSCRAKSFLRKKGNDKRNEL